MVSAPRSAVPAPRFREAVYPPFRALFRGARGVFRGSRRTANKLFWLMSPPFVGERLAYLIRLVSLALINGLRCLAAKPAGSLEQLAPRPVRQSTSEDGYEIAETRHVCDLICVTYTNLYHQAAFF